MFCWFITDFLSKQENKCLIISSTLPNDIIHSTFVSRDDQFYSIKRRDEPTNRFCTP